MQPRFADFSKFREEEESGVAPQALGPLRTVGSTTEASPGPQTDSPVLFQGHVPQKPMRRKLHPEGQNTHSGSAYSSSTPTTAPKTGQRLPARQKREIQLAIRKNKETNAVLTRLNSELQQQLKEVHLQRVTLESQLELLRPTTST